MLSVAIKTDKENIDRQLIELYNKNIDDPETLFKKLIYFSNHISEHVYTDYKKVAGGDIIFNYVKDAINDFIFKTPSDLRKENRFKNLSEEINNKKSLFYRLYKNTESDNEKFIDLLESEKVKPSFFNKNFHFFSNLITDPVTIFDIQRENYLRKRLMMCDYYNKYIHLQEEIISSLVDEKYSLLGIKNNNNKIKKNLSNIQSINILLLMESFIPTLPFDKQEAVKKFNEYADKALDSPFNLEECNKNINEYIKAVVNDNPPNVRNTLALLFPICKFYFNISTQSQSLDNPSLSHIKTPVLLKFSEAHDKYLKTENPLLHSASKSLLISFLSGASIFISSPVRGEGYKDYKDFFKSFVEKDYLEMLLVISRIKTIGEIYKKNEALNQRDLIGKNLSQATDRPSKKSNKL